MVSNKIFGKVTRITDQDQVANILISLIEGTFSLSKREWFLKDNIDTVNVYVNNREVPLCANIDMVNVKKAVKVAN